MYTMYQKDEYCETQNMLYAHFMKLLVQRKITIDNFATFNYSSNMEVFGGLLLLSTQG